MRNIDRTSTPQLIDAILAELRGSLRELRCGTMERMIRLGVSLTQMHVLWLLEHHDEMPMSRLAELLGVSVSNATGLVDRMEERGLVERVRVADDRRLVLVRMGNEGRRVLGALEESHLDRLQRALARLEPARLCGVLEAFSDFRAAIEADVSTVSHHHDAPGASRYPSAAAGSAPSVPDQRPTTP